MVLSGEREGRLCTFHCFAGGGGGMLADILLGHDIVGGIEIEEYPREVLLKRQADGILPRFPIWDDVCTFRADNPDTADYIEGLRAIRDRLIIAGGFPCFAEGTLILTRDGYKDIKDVAVGDSVLTHKGRWRRVTAVMSKPGARLVEVDSFGGPKTYCTEEHPYYISEWRKNDKGFRAVGSIMDGSYATTMVIPPEESEDTHTAEWWWLAGRYIADGWRVDRKGRKNGRVVIACPDSKCDELEEHIRAAGFNATKVKERTCNKYHITRGDFYADLAQFGRGASNKHLNATVYGLPIDKLRSFYEGYHSGDGYRGRDYISTTSRRLALDMCIVMSKIGLSWPGFYVYDNRKECVIEGRRCYCKCVYDIRSRKPSERSRSYREGDYIHKRIKSIRRTDRVETVYNLSVDEDESYVADGNIVHNCTDLSIAGKGAGLEGRHSGLYFELERIICEVRPRYVFIENSPMLIKRGLKTILPRLAQMGYDARWGVIGADDTGAPHQRKRFWMWCERQAEAYTNANGYGCERIQLSAIHNEGEQLQGSEPEVPRGEDTGEALANTDSNRP